MGGSVRSNRALTDRVSCRSFPVLHFLSHLAARKPQTEEERIHSEDTRRNDAGSNDRLSKLVVSSLLHTTFHTGFSESIVLLIEQRSLKLDLGRGEHYCNAETNHDQHKPYDRPGAKQR